MAKGSGRRSNADRKAAKLVTHMQPTRELSELERAIWDCVVGSVSSNHFSGSDVFLLEQYCACLDAFETGRQAADSKAMEAMGRLSLSYATRLRITPQSRYDARAAARSVERGRSGAIDDDLIGGKWTN
jgi:hypothetical protein